jgi:hypothetical protein
VTGTVGRTHSPLNPTDSDCKTVEINACVWDPDQKSVSFTMLAVFPTSARWQHFNLPRRGSLVTVMGDVVGSRFDDNQVVVLVRSFSYVSVRGTEKSTSESVGDLSTSSTPSSSRWKDWGTPRTPGKRRVVESDGTWHDGESPSRLRRLESPSSRAGVDSDNTLS